MELILTIEEFRTLVHALRGQIEAQKEQDQGGVSALLEKVLSRDFGFGIDELEILQQALEKERERFKNPKLLSESERERMPQTQCVLEHVIDKVVEASAMV